MHRESSFHHQAGSDGYVTEPARSASLFLLALLPLVYGFLVNPEGERTTIG
jgi:hypothetical protein